MQCDLCESVECSWNGSMTNTAWLRSTHRRCFSCWNLVWIGKYGELEEIVNIPVTQIVEEITELNIPVTQIVEEIAELNIPVPQIVEEIAELNIPVPQIVEEIAEVSKSSIEWRSIPNLHIEGISVSWMSLCETDQLIQFCVD